METRAVARSRLGSVLLAVAAWLLVPGSGPSARAAPPGGEADSVVVVVAAESPVTEMSRLHLADLYLGRTDRFPNGDRAVPIDQVPGSDVREAFYETYLGRSPAEIKSHWSRIIFTGRGRPPRDVPGGEDVKELVAGNPAAIGYIDRSLVDESVRVLEVR